MKKLLFTLIALSLVLPLISSTGFGAIYTSNNPLEMHYGETKVIDLQLTNKDGTEPSTFQVDITEGSDIVSLVRNTYTVEPGSELFIQLTISVPDDYSKNVQRVKLEAKTLSSGQEGGMVALGTAYNHEFDVILSQSVDAPIDTSSNSSIILVLIIAVIALAVIVFFIMRRR